MTTASILSVEDIEVVLVGSLFHTLLLQLQSIAASLDSDQLDEPAVATSTSAAQDTNVSTAKHMPLELAFTLMELIAGGAPETKSAAIQALASFLIVRHDLASKLGGFGGLGGAYFGLHEQLRHAGRAGARALMSLLGARADAGVRESALAAVAGAAAGSRRLLGWLEEEGVAPALMRIFRTGENELLRSLVLAAAFNVGALKGKLTGMGGEDVRSLVEYLKTEPEEVKTEPESREGASGEVVELGAPSVEGESKADAKEPVKVTGLKTEVVEVGLEQGLEKGLEQGAGKLAGSVESGDDAKAEGVESKDGQKAGGVESNDGQKAEEVSNVEPAQDVRNAEGAAVKEADNASDGANTTVKTGVPTDGVMASTAEERIESPDEGQEALPETATTYSIEERVATDLAAPASVSPRVSEAKGDEMPAAEPPRVALPLKECKAEPEDGVVNLPESAPPSDSTPPEVEAQSSPVAESGHVARPPPESAAPSDDTPRVEASEQPVAAEVTSATIATAVLAERPATPDDVKDVVPATNDVTALVPLPEGHVAAQAAPSPKPSIPASPYDHAAGVLVYAALGCDSNGHVALVGAGGIPHIMRVLAGKGRGLGGAPREAAAAALMMLAASSEQTSRQIRAAGGVAPLVEILGAAAGGSSTGGKVWGEKEAAAAALVVLAGED